ncbi:hypothetical protein EDB19DRAFT_2044291 [Suillus lakei]|nr:hypothetical protein EDB19DRAFT_2044291 [Suillus lakei]
MGRPSRREIINSTGSIAPDYVGETMNVPKILWFKKHMDPAIFARYRFFDLPDFFTYKATHGPTVRLRVNDLLFPTKAASRLLRAHRSRLAHQ